MVDSVLRLVLGWEVRLVQVVRGAVLWVRRTRLPDPDEVRFQDM